MNFPNLVLRGKSYYFHCRVPADVRQFFPSDFLRKSLKTDSIKQATAKAMRISTGLERVVTMARTGLLTDKLIQQLADEFMDLILDFDRAKRYGELSKDGQKLAEAVDKYREERGIHPQRDYQEVRDGEKAIVDGAYRFAEHTKGLKRLMQRDTLRQDYNNIEPIADKILTEKELAEGEELKALKETPEYRRLCEALQVKQVEIYAVQEARAKGNFDNSYDQGVPYRRMKQRQTLEGLIAEYVRANKTHWKTRSLAKKLGNLRKIAEIWGNPCTDEIDRGAVQRLYEELRCYPKNRDKNPYAGKTLEECRELPGFMPLEPATFKDVWGDVRSLLVYGSQDEKFGIERNYASDTIFRQPKKTAKASEAREVYTAEDIAGIFKGLAQERREIQPQRYWIPLIGLYSGARLNEICQLYCDDVMDVDGIPCFRIAENPERLQSTKNAQSNRMVPIHPTLIDLGFLDFVESRRRKGLRRVWEGLKTPAVEFVGYQGNYSHDFSKWYNRTFRKNHVQNAEKKPFHSTRHTFVNWFWQSLRPGEIDYSAVKGLVGHLDDDDQKALGALFDATTWKVYAKELEPARLLETLKRLDYGVDLKLLRRKG